MVSLPEKYLLFRLVQNMSTENENSELINVDDKFHMLVTRSNQHKRISVSSIRC